MPADNMMPMQRPPRHTWWRWCVLLVLVALAGWLRVWVGASQWGLPEDPELRAFILDGRLHRLYLGGIVGVALAVSGVALQALLRNVLAEPFILGLSSGAGVGVMLQTLVFYQLGWSIGGSEIGALIGALAAMSIVLMLGRRGGVLDPLGLLLTGVVISTMCGAVVMLLNYSIGPGGVREDVTRWMMGYLNEGLPSSTVHLVAAATAVGGCLLWTQSRAMDVATLSDAEAASLGVRLGRLRVLLFACAGALAAGAVVLAGPVAFVGLIAPHLGRLLFGPRHGALLVASALIGAAVVVLADALSAVLAFGLGMGFVPLGVFTAFVGGGSFLWLLRPRLGRG